jgi:pyridoxamine 5'-phosphate oxidase
MSKMLGDKLTDYGLEEDPIKVFNNWYFDALKIEENADAMTLSTYDEIKKRPTSRTLLYKGIVENSKIVFYTNYLSEKGMQLAKNPEVAIVFYWNKSLKQVRIHGRVEKMDHFDSVKYFHSRDRASQLASYISHQSSEIGSKDELLDKLKRAEIEFLDKIIPMPLHWGGYKVVPYEFEFFLYGKYRLNDRFLFVQNEQGKFEIKRLQP